MSRRASIAITCTLAACAPLHRGVRVFEHVEDTRRTQRTLASSRTYDARVEVDGIHLVIALSQQEQCEETETPIIRRRRMTTITEAPGSVITASAYLLGVGGIALGALMAARPAQACASLDEPGDPTSTDPQACRALGWLLVAGGAVAVGVGAVNSIRAIDEEEDLGTHDGAPARRRVPCHAAPLVAQAVELRLGHDALTLRGVTSLTGVVAFSMLEVPADLLPTPTEPGRVQVGDHVVALSISSEEGPSLVAALREHRRSRVSRDASAAQDCARVVEEAEQRSPRAALDDASASDLETAWVRARSRCGERWTAEHESRWLAVEERIAHHRLEAILLALGAGDLGGVDELLDRSPEVASRLRDDARARPLLRKLVGEPARVLATGGRDAVAAQRRVCRARRLLVRVEGLEPWNQVKAEIAQNVSDLGLGPAANIVRLMDAAACE